MSWSSSPSPEPVLSEAVPAMLMILVRENCSFRWMRQLSTSVRSSFVCTSCWWFVLTIASDLHQLSLRRYGCFSSENGLILKNVKIRITKTTAKIRIMSEIVSKSSYQHQSVSIYQHFFTNRMIKPLEQTTKTCGGKLRIRICLRSISAKFSCINVQL